MELYERLSRGEEASCVLNPRNEEENSEKAMFVFSGDGVSTRQCGDFVRKLKF